MDKKLSEVFDIVNEYLFGLFEYTSIGQIIPESIIPNRTKGDGKFDASIYTPNELLTFCQLDLMVKNSEIDKATKDELIHRYKEVITKSSAVYSTQYELLRDAKHEVKTQNKSFKLHALKEYFEELRERKEKARQKYADANFRIDLLNAYGEEYDEILSGYGLPYKFNLETAIRNNNNQKLCIIFCDEQVNEKVKMLNERINKIFAEVPMRDYLSQQDLGKYEDMTLNRFLTKYKMELMYANGEITEETYERIKKVYIEYMLMCTYISAIKHHRVADGIVGRIHELPSYEENKKRYKEYLAKFGLPFRFNLYENITCYSKSNSYRKKA